MPGSVVVSGARAPIGKLDGVLASVAPVELGGLAIAEALRRGGVPPEAVDYVIMGQVLPAGQGQGDAVTAGNASQNLRWSGRPGCCFPGRGGQPGGEPAGPRRLHTSCTSAGTAGSAPPPSAAAGARATPSSSGPSAHEHRRHQRAGRQSGGIAASTARR